MGYENGMGGWAMARAGALSLKTPAARRLDGRVVVRMRRPVPRRGLMPAPRALQGYAEFGGYGDYSGLFSFVGKAVKAVGKAVGSVARVAAPVVGTVVGGPVGGIVGKAVGGLVGGRPRTPTVATPTFRPVAPAPTTRRATVTLPGGQRINLPRVPQVVTDVVAQLATPAAAGGPMVQPPAPLMPFPQAEPAAGGDGKILGMPPLVFGAVAAGGALLLMNAMRGRGR
jgi:hypothetical protein